MAEPKLIRVLMIGPGEGVGGGISTLVESFLPDLGKQVLLHYLPSVKHRQLKDSGKLSFRNIKIAISLYFRFVLALVRFRPQIIHLHTSQGIAWLKDTILVIIGRLAQCRVVLHIHGGNFDEIYINFPGILQLYTRKILGSVDVVISVSAEWKNRLTKLIPADRIFLLRNCIDVKSFQIVNPDDPNKGVNIFFLGRVGLLKGTFDLIDAINSIESNARKFHVWIAGPEEKIGDFQRAQDCLVKYELTEICELLRSVNRTKALMLFREASIFVLPSYYEGLPMVVLEALAAGLPIVATKVGGIPEVVQDGYNGFLIPVGNIKALACKLKVLALDSDMRKLMGKRSREIAEREFNLESYIKQLVELYSTIHKFGTPHRR
jgi:glycosyltransferase involved in cell wall biosynthesis